MNFSYAYCKSHIDAATSFHYQVHPLILQEFQTSTTAVVLAIGWIMKSIIWAKRHYKLQYPEHAQGHDPFHISGQDRVNEHLNYRASDKVRGKIADKGRAKLLWQ